MITILTILCFLLRIQWCWPSFIIGTCYWTIISCCGRQNTIILKIILLRSFSYLQWLRNNASLFIFNYYLWSIIILLSHPWVATLRSSFSGLSLKVLCIHLALNFIKLRTLLVSSMHLARYTICSNHMQSIPTRRRWCTLITKPYYISCQIH